MNFFYRFAVCLAVLVFTAGLHAEEVRIFGPKQYVRNAGAADGYSDTFTASPGPGRLVVKNGYYDGAKRVSDGVSSASVSLNGAEIFGANDFNQTVYLLEEEVLLGESNTISVSLVSNVDSFITVEIYGYTARPIVSFAAAPGTVAPGESSVLTWTSVNADSCAIEPGIGPVDLSGSVTVTPAQTTTYTLTATGGSGSADAQAVVTVIPLPTVSFSADPQSITSGQTTTLAWSTTNADTVNIDNGIGTVSLNDALTVSPAVTTIYTITAANQAGSVSAQLTVDVVPPITVNLTADPQTILPGESSILTWTSTNSDTVSIDNGIGSVALNDSLVVSPSVTTTYTVTATGSGGIVTDQITVTVIQPPTITFSADPTSISAGESATLTWSTTHADTVVIDQGIGTVAPEGSITVSPVETTTYALTATSSAGTASRTVTVDVSRIHLTITSPAADSIVGRPDVVVKGTLNNNAAVETGVTVNGIVAIIDGEQFTANHVPLDPGENTITVIATDILGNTNAVFQTVTCEVPQNYITINADFESGIIPMDTVINVSASFEFSDSNILYSGPDNVEFVSSTSDQYAIRITTPGIYYFTVEVEDNQAMVHSDSVTVEVLDPAMLDILLQDKWKGMKSALMASDIDTALTYHFERFHEKYSNIYNILGTKLPVIAEQMRSISPVYLRGDGAKYRITQDHDVSGQTVTITYYIYFLKDQDGIWKIEKY